MHVLDRIGKALVVTVQTILIVGILTGALLYALLTSF